MKRGLVSVNIPIWKPNLRHLKECIDSLLEQTYHDIELVIIYNKTPQYDVPFYKLMNEYNDNRIKVIEADRMGIPEALNQGIRNSNGEFIARMDGDDFAERDRFENQLKFKVEHDCNIVGSWANYISDEGTKIAKIERPINHREIRKRLMSGAIITTSLLMDRKMLDDIGLFDTSFIYGEDTELNFRAMHNGYKFGNVPKCLVSFRNNPESVTRSSNWRKARLYTLKAKKRAIFRYGFFKPLDILYFITSMFYYTVSPMSATKLRKILNQIPFLKKFSRMKF